MNEFILWLSENKKSQKTIKAYTNDLNVLDRWMQRENNQPLDPHTINSTDIKKYFAELDADHNVSPATRNHRLAALRVYVRWAFEIGAIEYDPTAGIRRVDVQRIPRDRSDAEVQKIQNVLGTGEYLRAKTQAQVWLCLRDQIIVTLAARIGLRREEIATLKVTDIDWDSNKINILGKGGKKATVRANAETITEIKCWIETRGADSEYVVCEKHGAPLTGCQVWRRIKLIGQGAGIADLTTHQLRHTYGHQIAQACLSIGMTQFEAMDATRQQMRHSDQRTTNLYFTARDSQIRAALEVM